MSEGASRGNLLQEYKLRLVAEPLEGAMEFNGRRREPQLALSVYDNQPRFTVYTNVEGDKQNGRIEGNMDTFTFFAVMQALREVIADPEHPGFAVENKGHFFSKENGRSEKPGVKSRTILGRNERGEIFMAVVANNRPKAQFIFKPTEYHTFINKDGTPTALSKVSELFASGYVKLMEKAVVSVLQTDFISHEDIKARKEAAKQSGGGYKGGGGGGYNRSNGNNGGGYKGGSQGNKGGYNKPAPAAAPAAEFDDDFPF